MTIRRRAWAMVAGFMAATMLPGLSPSAAISPVQVVGTVRDQVGSAIIDATITALAPGTRTAMATATSDATGNYALEVPPGTYDVDLRATFPEGPAQAIMRGVALDDAIPTSFALVRPKVRLDGVMYTESGIPLPSAHIVVARSGGFFANAQTAADGSYSMLVTPGRYTLSVSKPSWAFALSVSDVDLTRSRTLPITMPDAAFSIRVTDPEGNALRGAQITALVPSSLEAPGFELIPGGFVNPIAPRPILRTTDESGSATISGLLPGMEMDLIVTPPPDSGLAVERRLRVPITAGGAIEVQHRRPVIYSGRLTQADGGALSGFSVTLSNQAGQGTGLTNTDGSFTVAAPTGAHALIVRGSLGPNNNVDAVLAPFELNADRHQDLQLPTRELQLTFRDPSGVAVSGVSAVVSDAEPQPFVPVPPSNALPGIGTPIDLFPGGTARGRFFSRVVAGPSGSVSTTVFDDPAAHVSATPPTQVAVGTKTQAIAVSGTTSSDVVLPVKVHFRGAILSGSGAATPAASLTLRTGPFQITGQTAADGSFDVTASPGQYSLGVARSQLPTPDGLPASFSLSQAALLLEGDRTETLTVRSTPLDVRVFGRSGHGRQVTLLASNTDGEQATVELAPGLSSHGFWGGTVVTSGASFARVLVLPTSAVSLRDQAFPPSVQLAGQAVLSASRLLIGEMFELDLDAPSISVAVSPSTPATGWHRQFVDVSFTCNDPGSGIEFCPPAIRLANDGKGQIVTGEAIDVAGNRSSATVEVNIDTTSPIISATFSPAIPPGGWSNAPVTVAWTCSDATSGIASCSGPTTVGTEGAAQPVSGAAQDVAGNGVYTDESVSIDMTAPETTLPSGAPSRVRAGSFLQGSAIDNLSGPARIRVTYAPSSGKGPSETVEGWMDGFASTSWSAPVPPRRGIYDVTAVAIDQAGNVDPTPATGQVVVA